MATDNTQDITEETPTEEGVQEELGWRPVRLLINGFWIDALLNDPLLESLYLMGEEFQESHTDIPAAV